MKTTIDEGGVIRQFRFPSDTIPITMFHLPVDRATFLDVLSALLREQETSEVSRSHAQFVVVRDLHKQQVHVTTSIGSFSMPLHHAFAIVLEAAQ